MKKRILLALMALVLAALACNFPTKKQSSTPEPTPDDMQLFYGKDMQIMLPPSFVEKDVKEDLPNIINSITALIGSENSPLSPLVEGLEDNICWWGYDSASPTIYPTRLMVVKNKTLSGLPISMITIALERILSTQSSLVDQDPIRLGGREMTRFTYSAEEDAWVAYIFKEESRLWLVLFITTPANLAAQLSTFEESVASIEIDNLAE